MHNAPAVEHHQRACLRRHLQQLASALRAPRSIHTLRVPASRAAGPTSSHASTPTAATPGLSSAVHRSTAASASAAPAARVVGSHTPAAAPAVPAGSAHVAAQRAAVRREPACVAVHDARPTTRCGVVDGAVVVHVRHVARAVACTQPHPR